MFHLRSRFFSALLAVALAALFAVPALAQDVRIGIGFVLPPYVIRENNQGLEVEIIQQALAVSGRSPVFVYLPNLRLPMELSRGTLDAVAANLSYDLGRETGLPVFHSAETLAYHNYAITLAEKGLVVNRLGDLLGRRVLAFQNAHKYLGPEFRQVTAELACYRELADQSLHVGMLYADRADILISDKRIFYYWRKKLAESPQAKGLGLDRPLTFHDVFPPSPRAVFFMNRELRDDFDRGLNEIRKRGEIKALCLKYLGEVP
ncbi:transporter substrate-binding domain-containing protein [Pseudodesulfovibrio sp.]|uniref:substrate-binding periplasmic protein n=1 Tax=Pseudodesulfovibrio sp. TaxID=2035812 RepID=UPI00262E546F|nr:transporter substrate-binding domain-containing protein [Pseudodesulfovibrio sp.]MDD3311562.1 transporter substrate-binding domain-containing protein [Pseudodesulfovibrio sp.]